MMAVLLVAEAVVSADKRWQSTSTPSAAQGVHVCAVCDECGRKATICPRPCPCPCPCSVSEALPRDEQLHRTESCRRVPAAVPVRATSYIPIYPTCLPRLSLAQ